jgi:hypothetical protein
MEFKNIKKVAFRKHPQTGEVMAFYPDEPALFGDLYIACSSRKNRQKYIGRGEYKASKPAKPEEYIDFLFELEGEGILKKPYLILGKIK